MADTKDKAIDPGHPTAKTPEIVPVVPVQTPVATQPSQQQANVDALAAALSQAIRANAPTAEPVGPPPTTTIRPGGLFRVNDRLVDAEGRPVDPNKPATPPTPNQSQFPPPPGV